MADFTIFSNSTTGQTLGSGDTGVVAKNGQLITTGSSVTMTGRSVLLVSGQVASTNGVAVVDDDLDGGDVIIETGGSIFGEDGAISISTEFFLESITNHGALSSDSATLRLGSESGSTASYDVFNTGTISSTQGAGVLVSGAGAGDGALVSNYGSISGNEAIDASGISGTGNIRVFNAGSLSSIYQDTLGQVVILSQNDDQFVNIGTVFGEIELGNGDDFFNGIGGFQSEADGGNGDDIILAGASSEVLRGGEDNDRIFGNGGGDEIFGGNGNDIMRGGAEADDFDGGADTDWVYYQNSNASVSVDLTSGFGFGGHAEGDTYVDVENVFGTAGSDELNGSADDNYLVGGNGNDVMRGYAGNDQFRGDAGGDVMNGGAGFDRLVYAASNGAVNVNMTTGTASGGHATGDRFFNMEYITGSSYGDRLTGSTAGNQIFGLDGDDIIRGYLGNDLMNGGGGADTFVFDNNGGNDIVVAFENDVDKLDLSVYNYASAAQVLANTTTSGADVFITFDANDSIRLVGFAANIGDLSDDLIL